MNQRAGGNRNGRDRSNDGDETSDVFDMKALAASARSAATPSPKARPLGLSGVVGRRDSVVGMRIHEPAPSAAGLSWAWVVAGCLAVLAPGAAGAWWYLNHLAAPPPGIATRLPAAPPPAAAPSPTPAVAAPTPAEAVEIKPIAHEAAQHDPTNAEPSQKIARADQPSGKAERALHRHAGDAAKRANQGQGAAGDDNAVATADEPEANSPPAGADKEKDKEDKPEKAEKAAAPEKPAEAAEEEPAPSGPPKTVRELKAALNRLQSKVGLCHNRFEVDGTAQVAVLVSPSGTVESIHLKGDFEGTPTGDCIVRQVSSASFPTFDGSDAIRISHSFSLE